MTADREALVAEVAEVVAWHRLEVEHRAYPAYACACEQWHGAVGDDGGPNDGQHDTTLGHATHVADALADLLAAREQQARAEALRDAAREVAPALQNEVGGHTSTYSVRIWLRDRADRIEADA